MKKRIGVLVKKIANYKKRFKVGRRKIVVFLSLLLIAAALYYFKGLFVAATVNNRPIWRLSVIQRLEKQEGKTALNSLVTETLINQEGQRQKVVVDKAEIDQSVKQIEEGLNKQGQNLEELLASQGLDSKEFREQIRLQKIVEKILTKEVQVSDEEIKAYYDENRTTSFKDKKLEDVKEDIRAQLEDEKLQIKVQDWIKSLYDKAKINYFVQF
jgi:foldase protein PrsA